MSEKILSLDNLAATVGRLKQDGRRIVHCHGVFDLLHIGHIRHLEQARQPGDVLVVTVTADRFVDKGPHRPAFSEQLRVEAVASLACVDFAAVNGWSTAEETLRLLRPDVYVKGVEFKDTSSDPTGKMGREAAAAEEVGAELAFTGDIVFSSSNLINRYLSTLPAEINEYLEIFRSRYTVESIRRLLDAMASLRVLVIGDTILDEYHYCEPLGKSAKDPVLALRHQSHELFAGGVLAIANHLAEFAGTVSLVTVIGEHDSHERFIRHQLNPKIEATLFTQPGAPTTVKRRYLDGYSFNKLFEVNVLDDRGLPGDQDEALREHLRKKFGDHDLVLAADFGHGAISESTVELLCQSAPQLAVNTQANAANRGFNTLGKYRRADYACIAEHELRLEVRRSNGPIRPHMESVGDRLGCRCFAVTRGRKGCAVNDRQCNFVQVPAFARTVIDRVGAGDAFFAVSALAARLGADTELIGFLGNIAGAQAVEIIGNKKPVQRSTFEKTMVSLLK